MRLTFALMTLALIGCSEPMEAPPCDPPPEPAPGAPFIDGTDQVGIDAAHHTTSDLCELSDSGAGPGVCMIDIDDDDDLDLYFVDRVGFDNRMYLNDGGSFSDITAQSGTALTASDSMGCLAFDYDGDGDSDLFVTALGPDTLLRNDGGTFVDATSEAGLGDAGFSVSATAGDIEGDGDLDLFVGRLVQFDTCPSQDPMSMEPCDQSPASCMPEINLLYENQGGTFVDVAEARGVTDVAPTLAPLFTDFDADGDVDLYIGNDIGLGWPDRMYMNDGSGSFVDRAESLSMHGPGTDTMGVDVGDFDLDGTFDMIVSDFEDRPIRLFRCRPNASCSNEVAPEGTPYVKWAVIFEDFDHDVDLDLFATTGHVVPSEGQRSYLYFGTGDGFFNEYVPPDETGVGALRVSRGAAFGDIDNDGDVDIVIANSNDRHQVLLNQSAAGHYLRLAFDSQAAGAMVTVNTGDKTIREQLMIGGSYASSNDPRMHFGLGDACRADVSVNFLDGTTKSLTAETGSTVRVSR